MDMVRTNVSNKGEIAIPQVFRKRVPLTDKQEVELDQLLDGSVIVRPMVNILDLAGSIILNRSLLSQQQGRRLARQSMAEQSDKRGRSA